MSTSSTRYSAEEAETASPVVAAKWSALLKIVALPFLLSRVWVAIFAYWGHSVYTAQGKYLVPFRGGWQGVDNWLLNPWTTYDSERFVHVAERGYDVVTSVSFPLYSILLVPFRGSEVGMAAWGVLLSNVALLGALAVLYRLTARDFNEKIALLAVWATAFFPSTVIFSAVYAESLFLLLLVLTFWFARSGTSHGWLCAGVFGLLAGLTRNSGPILCAALLIEYSMQRKNRRATDENGAPLWCASCAFAPLLAFVAFQLYLKQTLGRSDLMLAQAHALGRNWTWPWLPVGKDVLFIADGHSDVATLVNFGVAVLGIGLLFAYWRRGLATYTAFLGGMLLAFTTYGMTYPPYMIGAMRYLLVTFPLQQRLALLISDFAQRPVTRAVLVFFALMISAVVAFGFGMKQFLF